LPRSLSLEFSLQVADAAAAFQKPDLEGRLGLKKAVANGRTTKTPKERKLNLNFTTTRCKNLVLDALLGSE